MSAPETTYNPLQTTARLLFCLGGVVLIGCVGAGIAEGATESNNLLAIGWLLAAAGVVGAALLYGVGRIALAVGELRAAVVGD